MPGVAGGLPGAACVVGVDGRPVLAVEVAVEPLGGGLVFRCPLAWFDRPGGGAALAVDGDDVRVSRGGLAQVVAGEPGGLTGLQDRGRLDGLVAGGLEL